MCSAVEGCSVLLANGRIAQQQPAASLEPHTRKRGKSIGPEIIRLLSFKKR